MPADSVDAVPPSALADVPAEPGAPKPDPLLVVDGVHKSFGGLVAVHVERLEVQRRTITGLIGPNGAGKTTFFNVLTGFEAAGRGRWSFDGTDMAGWSSHRIARQGMVRTFQLTKALRKMSVIDNMKLAAVGQRGEAFTASLFPWSWRAQEREIEARADGLLERFNLAHMRNAYAGTLSGGQRKLLEIARALMTEPELVMLDEPMAGVNPALVESLLEHVRRLPEEGTSVLFIEHEMDVVMSISDWVVCMAQGEIIAEGPPASVRANESVIDAYLGTPHDLEEAPGTGGRP